MIKRDELSVGTSCLSRASHDEPVFVLRAHDPLASECVRTWARRYVFLKNKDHVITDREHAKFLEAMALAEQMDEWRRAHGNP